MKIVVTGGAGKAGRATLSDLVDHGFEVVSIDLQPNRVKGVSHITADVTSTGETLEVMHGAQAVVHLAAIPAPGLRTDAVTFRINTVSTHNVFSAAATLGIKRVVWASSETLLGLPFHREKPRYAPIDEHHPLWPDSHYALSKLVGEVMAPEFCRWHVDLTIIGLRFSNIMEEEDYLRLFPPAWEDPRLRSWNLWGYIDHRDVAQSVRMALTASISGAENYIIAAEDTCMTTPSRELMAECFPQVPVSLSLDGHQTLLAIDKAKSQLGFQPKHSWRDHLPPT